MPRLVPPVGPLSAKIALVGEAPGATEERLGEPFVGESGDVLNKLLHQAGILRTECYINNVIKERPPDNDIKHFINVKDKSPKITSEGERYIEQLKAELNSCSANIIVALGQVPAYVLTGKREIMKWRGSVVDSTLLPGRKVLLTRHPAAALPGRDPLLKYIILYDLRRAKEESQYPELILPQRTLHTHPSFIEVRDYISACMTLRQIGFDIEVLRGEVFCLAIAKSATDVMCVPFMEHGNIDYWDPLQETIIWRDLTELLESPHVVKVGQNLTFDGTFMFDKLGIKLHPCEDTMVAQGILTPDLKKGLAFLTSIHTKQPYYKDDGKYWMKLVGSLEDFWAYNCLDAAIVLEILPRQLRDLERFGMLDAYHRQVSLIEPLTFMYGRGFRMDVKRKERLSKATGWWIDRMTKELQELCGYEINPNSHQQVKALFYVEKEIKPYLKDGKPTTDDNAMRRLAKKGIPEAVLIRDIRHLRKLKGTYYDAKLDEDNRLRCSMNPVGAVTGRLSSSKTIFGTGMNLQNQPPSSKRLMLADKGYLLYDVDFAQGENRIVAYCAPEPRMIEAFESGVDVHCLTASLIFQKPIEEISDEDGSSSVGSGLLSERYWGKQNNHSFNYGKGPRQFALEFDCSEAEARFFIESYHKAYPGIRNSYWRWIQEALNKGRMIVNPLGRKRIFLKPLGHDVHKAAYAHFPQSTIADKINRDGLIYLYEDQDFFGPVELLNQVHDDIVFQVSLDYDPGDHAVILKALIDRLQIPITWRVREFVLPVEVKAGFNIKDMTLIKGPNESLMVDEISERLLELF